MAGKKVAVSYDMEEDILHFFTGERIKDSIEMGDYVFDISHDERIVGWQINNASKFLSSVYGTKVSKDFLSSIKEAYMGVVYSKKLVIVRVTYFVMEDKTIKERELTSNIPELVIA